MRYWTGVGRAPSVPKDTDADRTVNLSAHDAAALRQHQAVARATLLWTARCPGVNPLNARILTVVNTPAPWLLIWCF